MSTKWKNIKLLTFGSSAKLLMHGFVLWYMWIKELFDKTCIDDYSSIPKDQRHKKTAFYDKYLINF